MAFPILAALAVAGAANSIYQGVSANQSAKGEASLMRQQGELERAESYREAARLRDEGYRFKQVQMMAYISSGVEIQGTPLLVMGETSSMAEYEAKAEESRGDAALSLASANAKIRKREGRAELISGIVGAGTSLGKAFSSGAFKSSTTKVR